MNLGDVIELGKLSSLPLDQPEEIGYVPRISIACLSPVPEQDEVPAQELGRSQKRGRIHHDLSAASGEHEEELRALFAQDRPVLDAVGQQRDGRLPSFADR
jgi:hypothetical protein